LSVNTKKRKIKLFIGLAVIIVLLTLILLLIHICSSQADSHVEQTELDKHESIVPEKEEIEEKKPVVRKQEKDEAHQEKIVMIDVDPRKNWQNSGITVTPEMRINITHEKGKWSAGHEFALVDAEGYQFQGLRRRYPSIALGALIGRVGNSKVFKVGNYYEIDGSDISGNLFLRINDADDYLFDNQGSITAKIIVQW